MISPTRFEHRPVGRARHVHAGLEPVPRFFRDSSVTGGNAFTRKPASTRVHVKQDLFL